MTVYESLSRIGVLRKRYSLKFLAVAFLGIHIPLIGIAVFFATTPEKIDKYTVIAFVLGLTLVATAGTLAVLNKLLQPLQLAKQSLDIYLKERRLPQMPLQYEDEVGQLLTNIHITLERLDMLLLEKTGVIDLLSHDLRSPVTRIIGLSQVQKIDFISGNNNIYADEIIAECNDMLSLLGDVLGAMKQEELIGKEIALTPTSLIDMVTKSIAAYDIQTTAKRIQWQLDIDTAQRLELEPTLFSQALKNIVNNAIKFSPPGSVVEVQSRISGTLLYLTVKDQGIGFKAEDKEIIFNRFTKAGQRGTAGEPSTGLGLYLSKRIARRHGGDLIAESDGVGKGAVFTFILPLRHHN